MQDNMYKRMAIVEAWANYQRAEQTESIQSAYNAACEQHNQEDASALIRKLRNKLLDMTDKQMSIDRISIDTTNEMAFLSSLAQILNSDWARYRQELRDLPQQDGFPFSVTFPTPPDAGNNQPNNQ